MITSKFAPPRPTQPPGPENFGQTANVFQPSEPEPFRKTANVDLAIALDTTGSMGSYIVQVESGLNTIFESLATKTKSFRVGLVTYHDFPPRGSYGGRLELPFTDDIGLVRDTLGMLTAEGGGDEAEAVFAGIQVALNMQWRPGATKILLVIGKLCLVESHACPPSFHSEEVSSLFRAIECS